MGNCCSAGEETAKSGAFEASANHDDVNEVQQFAQEHHVSSAAHDSQNAGVDAAGGPPFAGGEIGNNNHLNNASNIRQLNQYRLEREEATRREGIVVKASQMMVPTGASGGQSRMQQHRSASGIYTYYDPQYAAASAQDILRSAALTGGLVFADDNATKEAWRASLSVLGVLPVPSSSNDVTELLSRGTWEGVQLGSRGSGLASCGGENPMHYLDDMAETLLDSEHTIHQTSLFGGCPSLVEHL